MITFLISIVEDDEIIAEVGMEPNTEIVLEVEGQKITLENKIKKNGKI